MTYGQKTPKTASNRSKNVQIGFFGKNNPKYVFLKQFDNLQPLNAQIRLKNLFLNIWITKSIFVTKRPFLRMSCWKTCF